MGAEKKAGREMKSKWSLAIAVLALVIAAASFFSRPNPEPATGGNPVAEPSIPGAVRPGLLNRIEDKGELHAGYGVYPPYTQEDPNTKAVSGFSVEIIERIGKELNCKVVWHRLNWNTMSADLKRGEYDVIADPIFQTIPRAREFAFTEPYAYFADGIAVVRKSENRFVQPTDLNRSGVTIAVGQGWAIEPYVKSHFGKTKILSVQTGTDLLQVFNEVLSGRADMAIVDRPSAERFTKEHPNDVKALWLDNPPVAMPAGFALRPSDEKGAEFLNVCLRNLKYMGILDGLAKKYDIITLNPPQH